MRPRAQIGLHLKPDGSVDTGAFKIVYVAPMKALVAEMVGNFGKRLQPFGIQVRCGAPRACHMSFFRSVLRAVVQSVKPKSEWLTWQVCWQSLPHTW